MRFVSAPIGKYSPHLQILIYPVVQMFDFMLPSYIQEHYIFFHYTVDNALSLYLNQDIDKSIYANNHTSVQEKQRYRKYVDWSLIPSKYRTIYKHPITDNNEGDPNLIQKAKLALSPEISPLLVDDDQLARLPSTYILSVGHDHLRDEAFIYGGRLERAGVSVVHNHYEDTFHGSLNFLHGPFAFDIANQMMDDMAEYIKANL
jgi:acetyl esterase/lipase